ncbi:MAG: DUF4097 family beta strand repeat protein [Chloroflexi bacterium]|nr:DUF4097 family beta strand repeat protein [Chloroflexota bacterium]OJW02037.1 MAG: hypothetical protein BGO39_27505 [Chloroflexi bacterium 54-19]
MAEEQKNEQSSQAKETRHFEQVIPVNSKVLEQIKINNISGKTFISGGPEGRITIRTANTGSFNYTPAVEFKNDGAIIEISSVPSSGSDWFVKVMKGFKDTDLSGQWTYEDGEWVHKMGQWPEAEDAGLSWEERQKIHEEWRNDPKERERQRLEREREHLERERERAERQREREERQRQREERQRVRYEVRESMRQANEAARMGRNFWSSLEEGLEPLGEILNSFGRTFAQAFAGPDDLFIEIPASVELEAKSVSGGLEISNMTGYCVVKNTSGAITLSHMTGGVRVKGISGRVQGSEIGGRAEIKVTSGSVDLTNCNFTGLDLSVNSGRILVETALAEPADGDYKINTSNGAIKLLLPRDSQASIDCRTLNGRLTMPKISAVEIRNRPGQSQSRIELNGGGRRVSVNTLNGNLELALYDQPGENGGWSNTPADRAQANWPVPPVPPVPPIPPVPPVPSVPSYPAPWQGNSGSGFQAPTPPATPSWVNSAPVKGEGWNNPAPSNSNEPLVTPVPPDAPVDQNGAANRESPAPADGDKKSRQLDILQAIEKGEISVDEGMRRLSEIEA